MFTTHFTGQPNTTTKTYKATRAGETVYKARLSYSKEAKYWELAMRDLDGLSVLALHSGSQPGRDEIETVLNYRARQLDSQPAQHVTAGFTEFLHAAEQAEFSRDDEEVRMEHVLRTLKR